MVFAHYFSTFFIHFSLNNLSVQSLPLYNCFYSLHKLCFANFEVIFHVYICSFLEVYCLFMFMHMRVEIDRICDVLCWWCVYLYVYIWVVVSDPNYVSKWRVIWFGLLLVDNVMLCVCDFSYSWVFFFKICFGFWILADMSCSCFGASLKRKNDDDTPVSREFEGIYLLVTM